MNDWRGKLALLERTEPDPEVLRRKVNQGSTLPDPVEQRSDRRVAIIAFAAAIAIGAFALLFIAFLGEPAVVPADAPSSDIGLVPSGGTYEFSRLQILGEHRDQGETFARVLLWSRWTTPTYPGEAPCRFELVSASGEVMGSQEMNFATDQRGVDSTVEIPFDSAAASEEGVTARGSCGPGMIFDGRSQYVFSNLVVEPGRLVGDVAWSNDTPVGYQVCGVRVTGTDGTVALQPYGFGIGQGTDRTIMHLTDKFPDSGTAEVICEPYRTEDQYDRSHWVAVFEARDGGTGDAADPPCPVTGSIRVVGDGTTFDTDCLAIAAGRPTPFSFRNESDRIPQSFTICNEERCRGDDGDGAPLGTEIMPGPAHANGTLPPLDPGTYYFVDVVHPVTAHGTLYVVQT